MGFSLDEYDGFRGTAVPFELAACGSGGRWSKGETRPPTRDGRRPGCEVDLLLPMTTVAGFAGGKDVTCNLVVVGADIAASTGDDEVLGGADTFARLW
jgi:hypothetical protein